MKKNKKHYDSLDYIPAELQIPKEKMQTNSIQTLTNGTTHFEVYCN